MSEAGYTGSRIYLEWSLRLISKILPQTTAAPKVAYPSPAAGVQGLESLGTPHLCLAFCDSHPFCIAVTNTWDYNLNLCQSHTRQCRKLNK